MFLASCRKRQADDENKARRRSKRGPHPRDSYFQEIEVSPGVLEWYTDDGRGLKQPGSCLIVNDEHKENKHKREEGKTLWCNVLKPAGWKYKRNPIPTRDWIFFFARSPRYINLNVNAFDSYEAIYEQYKKDGDTMEHILARAAQAHGGNAAEAATARRRNSTSNKNGNNRSNSETAVARGGGNNQVLTEKEEHKEDNSNNSNESIDNSTTKLTTVVSDFSSDDGDLEESEPIIAVKSEDATTAIAGRNHDGANEDNPGHDSGETVAGLVPEEEVEEPRTLVAIKAEEDGAAPAMLPPPKNENDNDVANGQGVQLAAVKREDVAAEPLIIDLSNDAPPPPPPMTHAQRLHCLEKSCGEKAPSDILIDRLEFLEMHQRVVPQSLVFPERLKVLEERTGLLPLSA